MNEEHVVTEATTGCDTISHHMSEGRESPHSRATCYIFLVGKVVKESLHLMSFYKRFGAPG